MCFSGAVVSTSDYESAGLSLIPDEGSRCIAHPTVHPPKTSWLINGNLGKPGEGKLWKLECHSGPVSLHKELIFTTTDSKANATGDEFLELHPATACGPTLPT